MGWLNLLPNFRIIIFRGSWWGVTFLKVKGGGCNFYIKNQPKSKIFNDKKFFETKMFLSVMTKNSNWEILTKNLDTLGLRMKNLNIFGVH